MFEVVQKLKPYTKNAYKWLVLSLITSFVGNIMILTNPLLIGILIGNLSEGNVDFNLVTTYLIIIVILYITGSFILWLSQAFSHNYATVATKNLRKEMFEVVTHTHIKYLDNVQTGDVINRFTQDIDIIFDALSLFFKNIFQGGTTIMFSLGMLFYLNFWLSLVVVAVVPLIFVYTKVTNAKRSKRFVILQNLTGDLSATTKELIENKKLLKAYNFEDEAKSRYKTINDNLTEVGTKAYFQASINNPTYRLFSNVSFALLGLVAVILTILNNPVTIPVLTSVIMYSQIFQKPFNEYSVLTANFMAGKASVNRVLDVISENVEIEKIKYNIEDRAKDGNIEFKNINFTYDKKVPLIENFNLKVNHGMKVAIVGPTGSGKSTLINLLMRFYEYSSGEIFIDGKEIKDYNRNVLRQSFGLVLQEPWLFNGTIKANLKYGNNISDQKMIEICKETNVHNFINNLKDGYDTVIDDNINLSTGQKQLLTIARALITNPSMLILDEATSNVDSLMEYEITKVLNKAMDNKTSFIVAHRLSTIINSDIIIVMDSGKIAETGNHQELMKNDGLYKKIYLSQFVK